MDHITLLNVRLNLKTERPQLKARRRPHTLRWALAAALKNNICAFSPTMDCSGCILAQSCPYPRILLPAVAWPAQEQPPPRPLILRPAPVGDAAGGPWRTAWDLILVGTGWQYLKYLLTALSGEGLGRWGDPWGKGGWELQQVLLVHPRWEQPIDLAIPGKDRPGTGTRRDWSRVAIPSPMIIKGSSLAVATPQGQSGDTDQGEAILRVHFKTRTRLKRGGRYLTRPPQFPLLIRHLLRRAAALSAWYGGRRLDIAWPDVLAQAAKVQLVDHDLRWSRWSRRPGRVMHRAGFTGSVYYKGPWQPFSSLLALGTYVHVGHGTTFGGGQFTVHVE